MNERLISHLASVDIRHELGLPLAGVRALPQEDNPRLIHIRHGLPSRERESAQKVHTVSFSSNGQFQGGD